VTDPRRGQMFFAGIVFVDAFADATSLPKTITYKIRPRAEPYNKSAVGFGEASRFSWFTNLIFPSRSRPHEPKKTPFGGVPPGICMRRFVYKHIILKTILHPAAKDYRSSSTQRGASTRQSWLIFASQCS